MIDPETILLIPLAAPGSTGLRAVPARPRKGAVVAGPGYDLARLDALMPHPVYAWISWVQLVSAQQPVRRAAISA